MISSPPVPDLTVPSAESPVARRRLLVLDVVRGVAVAGILFANVATILGVFVQWEDGTVPLSHTLQQLLVQQRFFPIFSLLFGVGFGMLLASAERRAARPHLVLLRRLATLGVLGLLHQLLQPGEALLVYAIAGIAVLLPLSFVPRPWRARIALVVGVLLTAAAAPIGGVVLVPCLFLLGLAIAEAGLPRRVEDSARPGLLLALVAGAAAIPFVVLQLGSLETAGFDTVSSVAGLLSGLSLVGVLAALLHTPLRGALAAVFAPLGRMALTNYVGATVIGVVVGWPLYAPMGGLLERDTVFIGDREMFAIWAGCVLLLIVQSLVSRWWLARFGQGPLERLWRWATWSRVRSRDVA
ncbi:DUF418 domain-containing protein [Brachybacterium sp.]|uniref:DUF418 domain-containing protein n=1 Tax=Brachybacterium sp. TaxID=1891286 RepID=UPI002ED2D414